MSITKKYFALISVPRSDKLPKDRINFKRKKGAGRKFRYFFHRKVLFSFITSMSKPMLRRFDITNLVPVHIAGFEGDNACVVEHIQFSLAHDNIVSSYSVHGSSHELSGLMKAIRPLNLLYALERVQESYRASIYGQKKESIKDNPFL